MCLVLAHSAGLPRQFLGCNFGIFDMAVGLLSMAAPEMSLALAAQAEVAQSFEAATWGLAAGHKMIDAQRRRVGFLDPPGLGGLNLIHDVGYMDSGMVCSAQQFSGTKTSVWPSDLSAAFGSTGKPWLAN